MTQHTKTLRQNTTKNETVDIDRKFVVRPSGTHKYRELCVFIAHTIHYNELYWTFHYKYTLCRAAPCSSNAFSLIFTLLWRTRRQCLMRVCF